VIQAQCGDREALELLLRSVQPALHRYVSRVVGDSDADDVVQNVLVALARKLTWLAEPQLFRAWMFRIASRKAFDHVRKKRRRAEQPLDEQRDAGMAAPEPPSDELLRELLDSDRLTPSSRAVLVLHFQEELPLAEVAAILEIPLGTVKSRLAFGLKSLRRHLSTTRSL
jgi:RNA polymerase sigma-70 factor (ECF subfamily)